MACSAPPIHGPAARKPRGNSLPRTADCQMTVSGIGVDWQPPPKPAAGAHVDRPEIPGGNFVMSSTVEPSGAIEIAPIEDTSLLAFYPDMNLPERRTFWGCSPGWALDGMDFMI